MHALSVADALAALATVGSADACWNKFPVIWKLDDCFNLAVFHRKRQNEPAIGTCATSESRNSNCKFKLNGDSMQNRYPNHQQLWHAMLNTDPTVI